MLVKSASSPVEMSCSPEKLPCFTSKITVFTPEMTRFPRKWRPPKAPLADWKDAPERPIGTAEEDPWGPGKFLKIIEGLVLE